MNAESLKRHAESLAAERRFGEALASFLEAGELDPQDADIWLQASYVSSLMGRYRDARSYALRAASLRPRTFAVAAETISRLRTFNAEREMRQVLSSFPPPGKIDVRTLLQLGAQLSYFNLQEQALVYLDEARRADPSFPATLLARAQVLMYLGRFDDARADLAAVRRRAPQIAKTYWLWSRMGKATPAANSVASMRAMLGRPGLKVADTVMLAYALHQELDDLGEYDEAAKALDLALRTKRAAVEYQASATTAIVDGLIGLDWDSMGSGAATAQAPRPIFIVGPHRSGTSLLERLVEGSEDVLGIGEIYDFTGQMRYATDHHCRGPIDAALVKRSQNADFAAVGSGYLESVAWRLDGSRAFTDKLPTNFFNVGYILKALPDARILHLVRDPVEVGFSNLRELFGEVNAHSYDQLEMADYLLDYRRLMEFWRRQFPGRILDVPYRELTQDPGGTMSKVAEYCGLALTEAMTRTDERKRAVATASAVQVRQGVTALEVPKWKPYEEYLRPMMDRLVSE